MKSPVPIVAVTLAVATLLAATFLIVTGTRTESPLSLPASGPPQRSLSQPGSHAPDS